MIPDNESTNKHFSEETIIPVIKEEITVAKEQFESGKIIVEKKAETEPFQKHIELTHTNYHIERIPKNKVVKRQPSVKTIRGKIIISVVKEVPVVVKQLVVVEEIHLTPVNATVTEEINDTIQKETINIYKTNSIQNI